MKLSHRAPVGPGIGANGSAADPDVAVHFPDRSLSIGVPKEDAGTAVCSDGVPVRPGIDANGPPPIRVLPSISQIDTWPSVFCHRMSEFPSPLKCSSNRFPTRSRIGGHGAAADPGVAVHFPDRDLAISVLPQDVRIPHRR